MSRELNQRTGSPEPPAGWSRHGLSEAEKDAPLVEQALLIERLTARVAELEALLGKPRKTSANSHIPPSRGRAVAAAVPGDHRPDARISDRYAGQQELGRTHQV